VPSRPGPKYGALPQTPFPATEPSIVDRLVTAITELHSQPATRPDAALDALAQCVLAAIPGAEHVGIGQVTDTGFEHAVDTSEIAQRFAVRQTELADGPALDVAAGASVAGSDDLDADERWSGLGLALNGAVRSALTVRAPSGEDGEPSLVVTVLSSRPQAFSEQTTLAVLALAACGALAAASARRAARIANLERALETNRDIGTAIGVLMGLHRTTREHAFDLLRQVSQTTHRKVSEIARMVAETGSLDPP
jgi:hypothetical protein